uniref:ZP domain-containing protein-like n=1 Tax=Petromyzon marinus TaxID=7757 RepID=A0AAJ7WXZ3_PETMA|nr:ZP domain-containing protein-like [Petromyzon marinus]
MTTFVPACASNSCQYRGYCIEGWTFEWGIWLPYSCICYGVFYGPDCGYPASTTPPPTTTPASTTTPVSPCASNPCLNGGDCIEQWIYWWGTLLPYYCNCHGVFYGLLCEDFGTTTSPSTTVSTTTGSQCEPNPCQNGGTCFESRSLWWNYQRSYQCICPPYWSGPDCAYPVSTPPPGGCLSFPCLNGGVCNSQQFYPYYKCRCSPGLTGVNCEHFESPQLNCTSQSLELQIPLDELSALNLSPFDIHLEDPLCRGYCTQQYLILHSDLQSCGTTAEAHGDTIVYSNTAYGFVSGTTAKKLRIPVHCYIGSEGNVVASYVPRVHDKYSSGTFDLSMVLYMDQSFGQPVYSYPFEVDLGAPIYVEVFLSSHANDLRLFLETCRASPFTGANDSDAYFIIRNGCQQDLSYVNYNSGDNKRQRFSFQSVEFSNGFQVYLECSVRVCHISDLNSRCQRGCVRAKRSVRDLVSRDNRAEHKVDLSQGPVLLRKSRQASGVLSSLAGMVYALAAALAVAAVCVAAVKVYRHRAAGPRYKPLVTYEEFTT